MRECPCGCGTSITGHDLKLCKLVDTFNAHQKLKEEADDVANELAQKVEDVISLQKEVDALKLVISDIRKNKLHDDESIGEDIQEW